MSLINKTHFRKFVLHVAKKGRYHEFTLVSQDFIDRAEASLKVWVLRELHQLPSKGKTIK